uniref:Spen paralogue and orthologue SPOC C-terminal domain-containing protein n=1 Tax=Quercus lobata TaxID=97700 RepID=A0A7N2R044_QUELO
MPDTAYTEQIKLNSKPNSTNSKPNTENTERNSENTERLRFLSKKKNPQYTDKNQTPANPRSRRRNAAARSSSPSSLAPHRRSEIGLCSGAPSGPPSSSPVGDALSQGAFMENRILTPHSGTSESSRKRKLIAVDKQLTISESVHEYGFPKEIEENSLELFLNQSQLSIKTVGVRNQSKKDQFDGQNNLPETRQNCNGYYKNGAEKISIASPSMLPQSGQTSTVGPGSLLAPSHDLTHGSLKSTDRRKLLVRKVAPTFAEKLWDGSLQLNSSVNVFAVAFFKSGERMPNIKWCQSVEVKGKVRLEAFEKYIQDLPHSRNRGLMV